MRGKKLAAIFCGFIFALVWCSISIAADKVGYINLQRLVNESKMGKEAQKDIQKLRKKKEDIISVKLKEANKLKDQINDKASKLKPREKRDKINEYNRLYKEIQRLVADAKEDITLEDRELVSIILEKADGALKKVAKAKKYTIILKDPNAVGYLDPSVDITDLVLKELNKK